jgi:hypothetical protein
MPDYTITGPDGASYSFHTNQPWTQQQQQDYVNQNYRDARQQPDPATVKRSVPLTTNAAGKIPTPPSDPREDTPLGNLGYGFAGGLTSDLIPGQRAARARETPEGTVGEYAGTIAQGIGFEGALKGLGLVARGARQAEILRNAAAMRARTAATREAENWATEPVVNWRGSPPWEYGGTFEQKPFINRPGARYRFLGEETPEGLQGQSGIADRPPLSRAASRAQLPQRSAAGNVRRGAQRFAAVHPRLTGLAARGLKGAVMGGIQSTTADGKGNTQDDQKIVQILTGFGIGALIGSRYANSVAREIATTGTISGATRALLSRIPQFAVGSAIYHPGTSILGEGLHGLVGGALGAGTIEALTRAPSWLGSVASGVAGRYLAPIVQQRVEDQSTPTGGVAP